MRVWNYWLLLFVCNYITSRNGYLGLMSKSRMRIRVVKAAAVLRLLRGTVSPSGSRDVKKEGEKGRGRGRGESWFPWFELERTHTKSNEASVRSMLRLPISFCLCFLIKLHIHFVLWSSRNTITHNASWQCLFVRAYLTGAQLIRQTGLITT